MRELRRKAGGIKFRGQHPCGRYVIDFYCAEAKQGIEVDGAAHDMGRRPDCDEARDAFISEQGIDILRMPASDVLKSVTAAAETIVAACRAGCT